MPPTTIILVTTKKNTEQGVKTSEGRRNSKQKERREIVDCHLIRTASKSAAASKGKSFILAHVLLIVNIIGPN